MPAPWVTQMVRDHAAEDAAAEAAEAAHRAECDGQCTDCAAEAWDAEMERRFEAMRDARFEN